jgi:hypothetical protein
MAPFSDMAHHLTASDLIVTIAIVSEAASIFKLQGSSLCGQWVLP